MVKIEVIGLTQKNEKLTFLLGYEKDKETLIKFFSKKFKRKDVKEIKICCKLFPRSSSKENFRVFLAFPKLFKIKFKNNEEKIIDFREAMEIEPLITILKGENCGIAMLVSTFKDLSLLLLLSETNI